MSCQLGSTVSTTKVYASNLCITSNALLKLCWNATLAILISTPTLDSSISLEHTGVPETIAYVTDVTQI